MKKKKKFLMLILVLSLVLLWLVPFAKNEILTVLHGSEFEGKQTETGWIKEIEYLKVISYSKTYAEVYFVSKNYSSGNVYTFIKTNDEWIFNNWNTIWSDSGSASDVLWPYFWHIRYGGL